MGVYNYDASKQRTRKRIEHEGDLTEERLYLGGMEVYRRWRGDDPVEEIETHHLFVEDQRVLLVEDVWPRRAPSSASIRFIGINTGITSDQSVWS